jgi:hypothetical protein
MTYTKVSFGKIKYFLSLEKIFDLSADETNNQILNTLIIM